MKLSFNTSKNNFIRLISYCILFFSIFTILIIFNANANPGQDVMSYIIKKEKDNQKLVDSFKEITSFLKKPFNGFEKKDIVNTGYGIIALSNMSEGLVKYYKNNPSLKDGITEYLNTILNNAVHFKVSPYKNIQKEKTFGFHGLYLTHFNIILCDYQYVTGSKKYLKLNEKISKYLADCTIKDPQKHCRSYNNLKHKWPADQAALLYSLHLYDQNNGTKISKKPIKEWFDYMENKALHKKTGLPVSNITGKPYGEYPRGSAISWTIHFISSFNMPKAEAMWKLYKEHFMLDLSVLGGFREYPKGIDGKEDIDSGPIIKGLGSSASALGIVAAAAVDDRESYNFLVRSFLVAKKSIAMFGTKDLKKVSSDIVAKAILFNAYNY